jgi:gliding motility-associated-like protein
MNRNLLLILLSLLPILGFGFTFTATPTAESCLGNGSIAFTTSNADPLGTIVFEVYLLPNTALPVATVTTNSLGGLAAGNYRIIAKETVGGVVTVQQQDVTINFSVVPLVFNIQTFNQACSANSNITVNTTSGVGVSYEIFSGPITFPPQTSNTFSGLPVGVYRIRVFDNCGTGVVSTFTVTLNITGLVADPPTFSNTAPPDCNFTVVNNSINAAAGTVIGYPIDIQYIVHPPGGAANQIFNSTLAIGNLTAIDLSQTIPYYLNQIYDYDIIISDACGSVFTYNFPVNQNITLLPRIYPLVCNTNYFDVLTTNFTPPFNLNFNAAPAGFNPINFNVDYPGPYSSDTIAFGSATNPAPIGSYDVTITDVCGRTTTTPFTISTLFSIPVATGTNNGCATNSGKITIAIAAYKIVSAILTAAPAAYPNTLPFDYSAIIDTNGNLTLDPLPLGDYTFLLTDNCGNILSPLTVTVPIYTNQGLSNEVRPGCNLGESSIRISSLNIGLSSINITAAPAAFPHSLPFNASSNIAPDGNFYMAGLPAGNYVFEAVDSCNFSNTLNLTVIGYAVNSSSFSLQSNCGSFDIPLNFASNGNANETYWLQKLLDPIAGIWGHPGTSIVYDANTVPNGNNSFPLINNTTNLNLIFNGTFRIVRSFSTFNNGADLNNGTVTSIDKYCVEILSPTLSFSQVLEFVDAHRMPCTSSGNLDVILSVNGTAPIQYSIVEKDGIPFSLNNGTSNIFYNLPGGIYTFQIQDNCGNIINRVFDVNTLLSLVILTKPSDLLLCEDVITNNETFDLTAQTPVILGSQSPSQYTISYHESLSDAENSSNAITNLAIYNPTANPQTVYARVVYNQVPICYETIPFDVTVGQTPKVLLNPSYLSCQSVPVVLDASTGNLTTTTYLWPDGSTGPTYTVTTIGVSTVTITATNSYGIAGQNCSISKQIDVTLSELPIIDHFETTDWTNDENTITVYTSNTGSFEYSLDNITFQDSNVFNNLQPGVYTVYVKDKFNCGFSKMDVWLLYYPLFFTPNGDTYNDTWFIPNAEFEPDLKVYIYDRYGKLITYLDNKNKRWDGTYNGTQAVSTDYWFVVSRQDGRTFKGHFSLKR